LSQTYICVDSHDRTDSRERSDVLMIVGASDNRPVDTLEACDLVYDAGPTAVAGVMRVAAADDLKSREGFPLL
jgi:hypothetical protein